MDDCGTNSCIIDSWHWQGDDYWRLKDTDLETSECLWNGVSQNDFSCVFDETTPVKDCGDLEKHVAYGDDKNKKEEEYKDAHPRVKRRRMLQFNTHSLNTSFSNEAIFSRCLKSNNKDASIADALPEDSIECSGFPEHVPISCYGNLDNSSERWIAECLNDADVHCSPEDLTSVGACDSKIDGSKTCDTPLDFKSNTIHCHSFRTSGKVIIKGRKSYIRTPRKLASSVSYPFGFIKPCGLHGDVTLKDINQRICMPAPKRNIKNLAESLPTTAFSGKRVVGVAKIQTYGGKGSISITRTTG